MRSPVLIFMDSDTERSCKISWPEKWMSKAYTVMIHAFIVISSMLISGLYARVVYTLWFKRNDVYEITHHQKVRGNGSFDALDR